MVWTDAVQGATHSAGWSPAQALQRGNAPSRPTSRMVRTRIDAGQRCTPCEYASTIRRVAPLQGAYSRARLYCYTGEQHAARIPRFALASADSGENARSLIDEMSSHG
jgi:hypothetical protein